MRSAIALSVLFLYSPAILAEECTHLWKASLAINPEGPKEFSGDTYAAYGLLGFKHRRNLHLKFKGEFFRGRFMSFESYRTRQKLAFDALYDHEIAPDAGSENPYREGVALDTPARDYTVDVTLEDRHARSLNTLYLAKRAHVHSIFYRAYVPNHGVEVTKNDLPKIYSYDSETGAPAPCPESLDTTYDPGIITVILRFIKDKTVLDFKEGGFWNGTNHAIPKYVFSLTKIRPRSVSVIRFKSPSYVDTTAGTGTFDDRGDVRYWSFCIQNLVESQTLGCLPDYLARPDRDGFVTVVIGDKEMEATAVGRGHNFLYSKIQPDQTVMGYFYRNLFPKDDFPMYQGDYLPTGIVCSEQEFKASGCER